MALVLIAEFEAAPGREDDLRSALEAMIEPSVDEAGCLRYEPFVDPNRPGRMVLIEEWTGPDALEFHFTTPHFQQIAGVLEGILARPLNLRRLVDEPASA